MLAFITSLVIYSLGRRVGRTCCGAFSALFFLLHPAVAPTYTSAFIDMPMILCTSGCLGCFLILITYQKTFQEAKLQWICITAAGVLLLAGACGTKLNGTVAAAVAAILWLVRLWRREKPATRLISLTMIIIGSFSLWVAVNPTLYPDLIGGIYAHLTEFEREASVAETFCRGRVYTLGEHFIAVGTLTCGFWPLVLPMLGIAGYTTWVARRGRPGLALICLWWWTAFIMVTIWIKFAWARYTIPIIPPMALLLGFLLDEALIFLRGHKGEAPGVVDDKPDSSRAPSQDFATEDRRTVHQHNGNSSTPALLP